MFGDGTTYPLHILSFLWLGYCLGIKTIMKNKLRKNADVILFLGEIGILTWLGGETALFYSLLGAGALASVVEINRYD